MRPGGAAPCGERRRRLGAGCTACCCCRWRQRLGQQGSMQHRLACPHCFIKPSCRPPPQLPLCGSRRCGRRQRCCRWAGAAARAAAARREQPLPLPLRSPIRHPHSSSAAWQQKRRWTWHPNCRPLPAGISRAKLPAASGRGGAAAGPAGASSRRRRKPLLLLCLLAQSSKRAMLHPWLSSGLATGPAGGDASSNQQRRRLLRGSLLPLSRRLQQRLRAAGRASATAAATEAMISLIAGLWSSSSSWHLTLRWHQQ